MLDFSPGISVLQERIRAARCDMLKPPPIMSVDKWADTYRRLSRQSSSTGGKFRTHTVEVARGPMRAITEPGVRKISIMSATQLMKTTVLENAVGFFAHLDPAPVLLLQPKEDFAETFSKEKLVPLITSTPELLKAFGGPEAFKSRSSDNTLKYKKFSGGYLAMSSAGSPTNLAMRSIRVLLMDEIDKYITTKEGDPISLAAERLETFPFNSIEIAVCSPTVEGDSRIEREYLDGDQRAAYCACPSCGFQFPPEWEDVHFKDEEGRAKAELAAIICRRCAHAWTEPERRRIMTTENAISWRQTRKFHCCGETQEPKETQLWNDDGRALCKSCGKMAVSNRHASFQASALYSPWSTLEKTVRKFLSCKGDREKLRTFINTRLARTFADEAGQKHFEADPDQLQHRAEPPWMRVPRDVLVLTAGVDTQDDRLEIELVGWGHGEESWSLEYLTIPGDPGTDAPWQILDKILSTPRIREDGAALNVQAACVDAGGHHFETVLAFCNARSGRRVYAIRGESETGVNRSPVWRKAHQKIKDKRKRSFGQRFWLVGTNAAKDRLESYMKVKDAQGPGAMHIPADREASWFDMFCAEKKVSRRVGGRVVMKWEAKYDGIRNEAWDCRVYAYAALQSLRVNGLINNKTLAAPGAAIEQADEEQMAQVTESMPTAATPEDMPKPKPPRRRPPAPPPRPSGPFGGRGGPFGGMRTF